MDSSSSSPIWKHQVFISFRGGDVRKTLYSHILQSLRRKGIDLFLIDEIPRGASISESLIEGIRGSEMVIVILSRNYASSSWCLDELVEIMKWREELGQKVLTIFYGVEPAHVRNQSEGFGKTFEITCEGRTKERIRGWIKALQDVANIPGVHSAFWTSEADGIANIATDVSNMLKRYRPSIAVDRDDVVGMRAHMEKLEKLLLSVTKSVLEVKVKPPQVQVFINYRGDVRNSFACFLADALQRSGINVFIDYQELRGKEINSLFKTIEKSGIAIVVFSSTYPEAKWCLNELVKITECAQKGLLKVLPIFFKVTPREVKRLEGVFGDCFKKTESTFGSDKPLIKRWKDAISVVSHKFGQTLDEKSNIRENVFVETIVKDVLEMLQAYPKRKGANPLAQKKGYELIIKEKTKLL